LADRCVSPEDSDTVVVVCFFRRRFYSLLFESWKAAGIRSYEIDFMKDFVYNQTAFFAEPEGARFWLEGMALAAEEHNITVQWCTSLGFDLLQALRYPAVTNIRSSNDYHDYPNHFVGPGNLISWALGLAPSKDVTWTTEDQRGNVDFWHDALNRSDCLKGGNHSNAELDVVLAVFSTGPVSLGDGPNQTNVTRAKATCMDDGTLLPPTKPLTPLDFTLWPVADDAAGAAFAEMMFECAADDLALAPFRLPGCFCQPQLLQSHSVVSGVTLTWHFFLAIAVKHHQLTPSDIWPSPGPSSANDGWRVLHRTGLEHNCRANTSATETGCCTTIYDGKKGQLPVLSTPTGWVGPDGAERHRLAWQWTMLTPVDRRTGARTVTMRRKSFMLLKLRRTVLKLPRQAKDTDSDG
jgi:hypothetical protein